MAEDTNPLSLMARLNAVQTALKAPKSQRNDFGKYNYRNAEDILEAAKPLLAQHGLTLTVTDEVVLIGERYYVKATSTVYTFDWSEHHGVSAFAREEETKKGMDGSQITGAASSYARKYSLNGLFDIDDTKDADHSHDGTNQPPKPSSTHPKEPARDLSADEPVKDSNLKALHTILERKGLEWDDAEALLLRFARAEFAAPQIKDITNAQAVALAKTLTTLDSQHLKDLAKETT